MDVINKIQWSKDYDKFKNLTFNRNVDFKRVKKIKEVIKKNGYLVPIIVNQDYYIIDGQHRIQAAKDLNIALSYMVYELDNDKLPFILADLQTSKRWDTIDYYYMWLDLEKPNYKKLEFLLDKYNIEFTILYRLLPIGTGNHYQAFKDGSVEYTDNQINTIENKLIMLKELFNLEPKFIDLGKPFMKALIVAINCKNYNHEIMKKGLKERGAMLLKASTGPEYSIQLEDIYNRSIDKKSQRIRLDKSTH